MNAHPRPYYYLENFNVALEWLRGRYGELLAADEQQFMTDFARLPLPAAALVVRMIMRQGDLFRTSKLNYTEIGLPAEAAGPLIELGWVDPRPAVGFSDLYRLLRKAELSDILRLEGAARALRKTELIELASELAEAQRPLDEWWPQAPDAIYQVRIAPLCDRLRLMFFGNFYQTWSEFVLADLGIFRYEKVSLEPLARAFQTRAQIGKAHSGTGIQPPQFDQGTRGLFRRADLAVIQLGGSEQIPLAHDHAHHQRRRRERQPGEVRHEPLLFRGE